MEKKMLPIYDVERDIVRALLDSKNKGRLIIEAPTGSGKSTQLPQILIKKNIIQLRYDGFDIGLWDYLDKHKLSIRHETDNKIDDGHAGIYGNEFLADLIIKRIDK